jgi:UrcA family protein
MAAPICEMRPGGEATMKTTVLAAFAATSLLAPAVLAPTTVPAAEREIAVSYAGLSLATPAGHAEALKRIRKAAETLCRERPPEGVDALADHLQFEDCVKQASQDAVARLPAQTDVAAER